MNKNAIISFIIIIAFLTGTISGENETSIQDYFFELVYKTNGGGFRPDYGNYIAQSLSEIGIKVNVIVEEWIVFVGTLLNTHDFDLCFVGLVGGNDPDMTNLFSEKGSLNMFGINTQIPYGAENEQMLDEGVRIFDFAERQQHYYDWQQLIMDKILPMLPFFSPRSYVANWEGLDGYDSKWGIIESLPYMEFTLLHEGQTSTEEFYDSDAKWKELNPLLQDDEASSYISSLVMEPLLQLQPDNFLPIKTGIVADWQQNETNLNLYKFTMRNNVYWNPSFNITGRDGGSDPLVYENGTIVDSSILMHAYDGAFSNGTNQQVTAKDAVFTLLTWANPITNEDSDDYKWIHDIWVDPSDPLSFWIEIDGNPATEEMDYYAPFWQYMNAKLLPEFFLNTSNTTITLSSGGVPMVGIHNGIFDTPQWRTYSTSVFGCGKYMLDYYVENSVTVLKASPFWFGVGAIDGTEQDLDIKTIYIRVISNSETALLEFKAGKLDVIDLSTFPDERREMITDPRFEVQSKLQNYVNFMGFNLRRPFIGGDDNYIFLTELGYEEYTKALAVRKAIAYAINRQEINNELHYGEYFISHSPIYPARTYWYYNDIIKYNYELAIAWKWMELAGYYQSKLTETEPTEKTTISEPTSNTTGQGTITLKLTYPFNFLLAFIVLAIFPAYVKFKYKRRR
ncbi:MAG: ABC transporter substrate-binding protein [Candidatus Heimdallarchaeaceae archaeon]